MESSHPVLFAVCNTIARGATRKIKKIQSLGALVIELPISFRNHYSGIMSCNDEVCVASNDSKIRERVQEVHNVYNNMQFTQHVSSDDVDKLINNLHRGCSPGMDGISSEHLIYGKSDKLLSLLSSFFTVILSRACVPTCFQTGIIIPILKKSTLDPNNPEHYRPITVSSIYSKLVEAIIIPDISVELNDYQFGFRTGRSTSYACNIINDTVHYFKSQHSPLYMCALDAEKCFDSINHMCLLYKLIDVLDGNHWLLLHKWYSKLQGVVRWNGHYSYPFNITRGTRQGSLLSPYLFNVFINGLNNELQECNHGISIDDFKLNNVTYADDITLICSSIAGLQSLIDICVAYSVKWNFNFNPAKSKCMTVGKNYSDIRPTWHINNEITLETVDSLNILGITFNTDGTSSNHTSNRISKCRQSFYGLRDAGMSYPGADAGIKKHLWATICRPTLLYGMECVHVPKTMLSQLETVQGNHIKQSLGLSRTARTSYLLDSLHLPTVQHVLSKKSASFYNSIFKSDTPTAKLNSLLLARYVTLGELIPGTLIHKLVKFGFSPISVAFNDPNIPSLFQKTACGIIDSLQNLLYHQNFVKPYSDEHYFVHLLTKSL